MKKIVFLMPNLLGGGAEKVLIDILKLIDKSKYNITLILLYNDGVYLDDIPEYVNYKYLFPKINNKYIHKFIDKILLKYFCKIISKYLLNEKYDIGISFMEGITTKILSVSGNKIIRKIAWIHTDMDKFRWSNQYYKSDREERLCYERFNKIIFVSENSQKAFLKRFNMKLNENSYKVIYNPIIEYEINNKAKELDIYYDNFTVITLGRLIEVKGFERLIQIHKNVKNLFKHDLVIIGDGPDKEKLSKLINKLNVQDSVKLLGFKSNPYPYIKAADLYICSSFVEGYPISMLEAIILEKPIMSTAITGPKDILYDGEYGFLCKNTKEGLENGLKDILLDNKILMHLKEKVIARKAILLKENSINNIEEILDE